MSKKDIITDVLMVTIAIIISFTFFLYKKNNILQEYAFDECDTTEMPEFLIPFYYVPNNPFPTIKVKTQSCIDSIFFQWDSILVNVSKFFYLKVYKADSVCLLNPCDNECSIKEMTVYYKTGKRIYTGNSLNKNDRIKRLLAVLDSITIAEMKKNSYRYTSTYEEFQKKNKETILYDYEYTEHFENGLWQPYDRFDVKLMFVSR